MYVDRLDTSTSSTLPTDLSSLTSTMRTARTMSVTLISKEGCGPCSPHLNVCHHAREDLMPLNDNTLASALTAIGYIGIAVSSRPMTMSADDLSRYLELRESSVSARREASQGSHSPLPFFHYTCLQGRLPSWSAGQVPSALAAVLHQRISRTCPADRLLLYEPRAASVPPLRVDRISPLSRTRAMSVFNSLSADIYFSHLSI